MRRGRVYKRCKGCSNPVKERRCAKCGSDRTSWAYVVDTAPVGEPRKQRSQAGFATKEEAIAAMAAAGDLRQQERRRVRTNTYLAQRHHDGLIKIGRSIDVPRRLADLARASGGLRTLAVIRGDCEAELHARFAQLREMGEWFRPGAELIQFAQLYGGRDT